MKSFSITADDCGLEPGSDEAILRLAEEEKISAISVMPGSPMLPRLAGRLNSLPPSVSLGLHFCLTKGAPVGGSTPGMETILGRDGRFLFDDRDLPTSTVLLRRQIQQNVGLREAIRAELQSQERRAAKFLRRIDFYNYHHYLQLLHPWFDEVLTDLAGQKRVDWVRGWVIPVGQVMELHSSSETAFNKRRRDAGLHTMLSFGNCWEGRFLGEIQEELYVSDFSSMVKAGIETASTVDVIEFIVHPARIDTKGASWNADPYLPFRILDSLILDHLASLIAKFNGRNER